MRKTKSGLELKKIGNEGLLNLFAVNLPANDFACCENDRKNTNMIVRIIKRLLHTCQKKKCTYIKRKSILKHNFLYTYVYLILIKK